MVINTASAVSDLRPLSSQSGNHGPLSLLEERELSLLLTISRSPGPIGSPRLAQELEDRGIVLGEATVGRLLRSFQARGFVSAHGRRGRLLTAAGRNRLSELRIRREHTVHLSHITDVLRTVRPSRLIDVLVARRAIESELAALAAERAGRTDVKRLERIILESEHDLASGTYGSSDDVRFHDTVAVASKNKVLLAAFRWMLHTQSLSPLFMQIRKETSGEIFVDHKRIFDAIVGRTPEAARYRMTTHLNRVIRDVEAYWKKRTPAFVDKEF